MRDKNCISRWDSEIEKPTVNTTGPNTRKREFLEVKDARGVLWDVKEARATKHGFDVLYGHRVSGFGPGGSPKLIVTRELKQYWEDNAIKHDGALTDLPIPPTTRKRARKRFKMNYFDDIAQFWEDNMEDVKTLTPRQFSTKHNMPMHKVSENYFRILGRRARAIGWWKDSEVMEVLLSRRTLADVGRQFGIGTSQAHRLRRAAQALHVANASAQDDRWIAASLTEEACLDKAA